MMDAYMNEQENCEIPRTREIELLGTKLRVKNTICARDGGAYRPKPAQIKLQLSILPTRFCPAHCPFCIAAPTGNTEKLQPEKLRRTLLLLRGEDCVRGISITGGEPFTDPVLLDEVISLIFDIFGRGMEVTVDTNGSGIRQLQSIRSLRYVDTIHISRHHWDDARNEQIFGCAMPTAQALREAVQAVGLPDLFVLNCVLLSGGVATAEDAHRYLDFALETGAGKVSFITAAPVNAWTAAQRVSFDSVLRDDDPSLLFVRGYRDFDCCRCRDGVYLSPGGRLIEFYGRCSDASRADYCRGLVIEPDGTLRAGYGGTVIAGKEDARDE